MKPTGPKRCLCMVFAFMLTINGWPPSQIAQARSSSIQGPYFGTGSGPFVFNGSLRSLSAFMANALPVNPATNSMPSAGISFDGLTNGGDPPSTNGDVGPQHYIQAINTSFAVYSKTGTLLAGPISLNAFFAAAPATGTPCDTDYSTYPIVLYDPLADRWVLAVRAAHRVGFMDGAPFYECIAVSRTADPVGGGWYKYALRTGADLTLDLLNDAPKLAVWPDAYYMSANMFTNSLGKFDHTRVWALDRAALLAGKTLREVHFDVSGYMNMLPSNLRGARPPSGSPNYFLAAEYADANLLHLWRFHVDFETPANSWFGTNASAPQTTHITVASYALPTFTAAQPGTQYSLEAHAGLLMSPVQYRNINGTESLWASHTVKSQISVSDQLATRWYEIRGINNTTPAVYQQGTFDNGGDGVHRWMGSLAVDRFGNMAIGYSVTKPHVMGLNGVYPGIRYAGRLVTDSPGLLPQSEITLTAGTGIHNRCNFVDCTVAYWGKYTAMTVDPSDDCTFWYTNEYGVLGSPADYNTRIGSFRYAACTNANLMVDRSDDSDTRGCSTAANDCSLRGAINILNNGSFVGAKITFDPSLTKINLAGSLPIITASHNAIQGANGSPRIDGAATPSNTSVFRLDATNFSLSGLSVVNLDPIASYDVGVLGGTHVSIFNNYLGTLPAGANNCTPANPPGGAVTRNAWVGILVNADVISDAVNGSVHIYNNVIACHDYGIYLWGTHDVYVGQTPAGAASPNRIGLNAANTALPNHAAGIAIAPSNSGAGASGNIITSNTIANNGTDGIWLSGNGNNDYGSSSSNVIAGNRIYNNGGDGIRMEDGAFYNVIGGVSDAERNLIYGNTGRGISLSGSAGNGILGNTIGSAAGGNPNGGHGVLIDGGYSNWVGGAYSGTLKSRNVIGGNNGDGVQITNGSHHNTLSGSYIGTNASATSAVANGLNGVTISGGAHDNFVGGDDAMAANIIAGNAHYGVSIAGSSTTTNTLASNDIGLNSRINLSRSDGTFTIDSAAIAGIPNGWDGLTLQGGTFGNVITDANWIGYNTRSGIYIAGGAHHNTFDGNNRIFHNTLYGLILDGASTQNNDMRWMALYNNGLDGIGERNSAMNNRWSMLSTYGNGGMGIDKEAASESTNSETLPHPVITSVIRVGNVVTVSGRAQPSIFPAGSTVEVYVASVNSKGFAEGYLYLGATGTDTSGNWSFVIPGAQGVCFVAFEKPYSAFVSGYAYSTEFSPTNCRWFAPLIRRGL